MNIVMAFFDLVPVTLFLITSIILQRCLYNKMSKGAFAVFSSGTIFVFVAGLLKALHKILYYLNICDFKVLAECFFPLQTIGFVLAASGLVALMFFKQDEDKVNALTLPLILLVVLAAMPEEFNGTMIFVCLMVLGVALFDGILIYISAKKKNVLCVILFIISFIFILGMGYLSTKNDMSDWIKEFVNSVGQVSLLIGSILLKKSGLSDKDSLKGITRF